ncbi:MAG: hypothetical protein FK733_14575 [Asgard group archaeon]|nr:hypothetical protein [Asgard group archaeon]
MSGILSLRDPFIKVIQTCYNQNKANKIVANLKSKGYKELFTYHNLKTGTFSIGTFDYSKLNIFDQMNAKLSKVPCHVCGRPTNENSFFKCINCGMFECIHCGMKRLYNGKIPVIHNCGHDDFEFLANVGPCSKCTQPLGFRAVPQTIRMHMMASTLVGRAAMVNGIVGCYAAEELFIEKEIVKIYNAGRGLHAALLNSTENMGIWFKAFFALKSNYNRLAWSSSYVKDVLHKYLKMFGLNPNPLVNTTLNNVYPHFVLFKELMELIEGRMSGKIPNEEFVDITFKIYAELTNTQNLITQRQDESLKKIFELGHLLDNREHFSVYSPHIAGFFQLDVMDRYMHSYPGNLKC